MVELREMFSDRFENNAKNSNPRIVQEGACINDETQRATNDSRKQDFHND